MEWKLWEGDEPPFFTQPDFFAKHPRIAGCHQVGYFERLQLVAEVTTQVYGLRPFETLTDLGCGDGTLLNDLFSRLPYVKMWGYDLGEQNVEHARRVYGVDVRRGNVDDVVELGECVLLTEVLEHMVDPHGFLRALDAKTVIATSPSAESDRWHYEHHAWAWDVEGFINMCVDAGWKMLTTHHCYARDAVSFGPSGAMRRPTFQCVVLYREEESNLE